LSDARFDFANALRESYRIERVLGEGGMATVYLAHDVKHDRPVALKVLKPDVGWALGAERFEREIKLAARLQHPHILTVLDSGEIPQEATDPSASRAAPLFFTMPYVEGESLRSRLNREKQLPVSDALRIVREAAQGLEYAHRHGVVHRDVKPENLLLTEDGTTLVADFGIARALGVADSTLTQAGTSIGTAAYMSPEQAAGEPELSPRSDIYSLAIVLYEMLAGETPFAAPTPQATIARRFSDTPAPLRTLRDSVSVQVEQAVQTALSRTAADRFGSMREFADALGSTTGPNPTTVATAASTAAASRRVGRRPAVPSWAMLSLGVLIGLGALFAWTSSRDGAAGDATSIRRIAVLPFTNLGDSAEAYFADGLTDAVRGKLSALPRLEVIASASSNEYRASSKTPQQIAGELGVEYLLSANVRWAKSADGTSRVQVSPELIRASTAAVEWQQPFDASLTDVFAVQSEIAARVADALSIALGDSVKAAMTKRPTENMAAYDVYLRAREMNAIDASELRERIALLEQSVALDSNFVDAWDALVFSLGSLYTNWQQSADVAGAMRDAAQRVASLAPGSVAALTSMANYHETIEKDLPRAAEEYSRAVEIEPGNASAVAMLAAIYVSMGEWDRAEEASRRAQKLDPRSPYMMRRLGDLLRLRREYREADRLADSAVVLDSLSIFNRMLRVMVDLGLGDLASARAMVTREFTPMTVVDRIVFFAWSNDLYWVLSDEQRALLLRLPAQAFDDNRGYWGLVMAQTYWMQGDSAKARAYGDTASRAFADQATRFESDPQRSALHGLALAFAGDFDAALREGLRGMQALPIEKDKFMGPYIQHQVVRICILAGDYERALELLEPLLKVPYDLSPGWLRIDPMFRPLKGNPRFDKLASGS
jgi:serine/threonine-protein kinase